uniref:NADH-ubiquinone oxidoreductase chain 5 n=1 Tax=Prionoglaris stygia TaxID=1954335 RepID=A0A343QCC9_9NEOP|nr:NADH dehydrogenase subunit 5 [Prionoglaris stygia]ATU07076.1 NADH dehydrogenase subunit 5 [Prionoglaris stygia]
MYLANICFLFKSFLLILSFLLIMLGMMFLLNSKTIFIELELIELNFMSVEMIILLDWMSLFFMSFVLLISGVVIGYSNFYMSGDYNLVRFIIFILLFVSSMMLMIMSPNLISILLGWDGLGLVSYILVIYYQNNKSYNAGMLTVLSNRVGDVLLLVSIAWMLNFGSWNFLFYLDFMKNDFLMELIMIMVIIASFTKSAQIPFSSWLPAAMAAPTPISALVHSSTLVTAGVYLLIRFSSGFLIEGRLIEFVLMLSLLTMAMSGVGAMFEFDLKKIIALSTLSQLGLMISTLFLGMTLYTFFHLLTHAVFKALLFMCAGFMIHIIGGFQDVRLMGGLSSILPVVSVYFNISNLSLCGMPFLAGFYSKDLILESSSMINFNFYVYFLFYISTFFTVVYSFRLVSCVFGSFPLFYSYHSLSDEDYGMINNMTFLVIMVVFSGCFLGWMLMITPKLIMLSFMMKILTLFIILMGLLVGFDINSKNMGSYNNILLKLKFFLGSMWFLPTLSTYYVSNFNLNIKYVKQIELGWNEFLSAQGAVMSMVEYSKMGEKIQFMEFKILMMMYFYFYLFFVFYMFYF